MKFISIIKVIQNYKHKNVVHFSFGINFNKIQVENHNM